MIDILREQLECFEDINFDFDPKLHRYTYNGEPFISVTQYIQQFSKPFDQDYWSKRKADEEGITQDEILTRWQKLNDYANEIGTDTHDWIENYFNQVWQPLPRNLDVLHRINKFNRIHATHLYKLEPLKFEVRIFSKKWRIAGMIDALFVYRGKIFILDWKTNGDLTDDDHPKGRYEKLMAPFDEYYQNHVNQYSLQLSMYALILKEWGIDIAGAYLVYIGPNDDDAKIYTCVDMVDKLEKYLIGDRTE